MVNKVFLWYLKRTMVEGKERLHLDLDWRYISEIELTEFPGKCTLGKEQRAHKASRVDGSEQQPQAKEEGRRLRWLGEVLESGSMRLLGLNCSNPHYPPPQPIQLFTFTPFTFLDSRALVKWGTGQTGGTQCVGGKNM